jgi:hypothetical protein
LKHYSFKYIERYIQEEHTQKSHVKKYFILYEIQKRQISNKKIYYFTTILLLFTIRNLSFYIPQNITYFLMGLFSSCKYLRIYFNAIIFEDIEVCVFEIFKILKVKRALVPMCTKPLLHNFQYKKIITSQARWWGLIGLRSPWLS